MKAILIIDMPKSCDCCRFCTVNMEHSVICDLTKKYLGMADVIPDECPLRPIPRKKTPMGSDIFNDYVRGYNDCLDDLGEKE